MAEAIPPPYVITDDDKRGLLVVITATTLSFVWTCLLIRIWLRYKTREWRSDDYFLAAATMLDTVQSGLMFHIVNEGLGTSQASDSDLVEIGKDEFGSQILYILTLLLSKYAVLFLYLRLSPGRDHAVASWATIALSAVWAVVALILIAVPCNPSHFWPQGSERCSDIYTKWQAIGALDTITEAFIFFISVYLVAGLNMKMKSKVMVVTAFSSRLPVIAASAVRLYYLRAMLSSPNRNLDATYYVVCTQWHLGYAIMSSTITGLGPFLRPFSKSFSTSYRRSSLSHNPSFPSSSLNDGSSGSKFQRVESFQMDALHARKTSILSLNGREKSVVSSGYLNIGGRSSIPNILDPAIPSSPNRLNLRPDNVLRRDTAVEGGVDVDEDDALSSVSNESRKMIITKRTELKVETDRASAISAREWREGSAAV